MRSKTIKLGMSRDKNDPKGCWRVYGLSDLAHVVESRESAKLLITSIAKLISEFGGYCRVEIVSLKGKHTYKTYGKDRRRHKRRQGKE